MRLPCVVVVVVVVVIVVVVGRCVGVVELIVELVELDTYSVNVLYLWHSFLVMMMMMMMVVVVVVVVVVFVLVFVLLGALLLLVKQGLGPNVGRYAHSERERL